MILSYAVYVDGEVAHKELQFPFVTAVNGWMTPLQEHKAINNIAEIHGVSPAGIRLHRNTPRFKKDNEIDWEKDE